MLVYLKDGSALDLRAAILRQKLQIKLSTSPSQNILTMGQTVLYRKANARVATGVPI